MMTSKRPKHPISRHDISRHDISAGNGIPADPLQGQSNDVADQAAADDAGIEKVLRHAGRRPKEGYGTGSRKPFLQGKKTHERQLRILQRKPDRPDE
ncbi:MAG: hypothetical protein ACREDL_14295 [Bradyrhizobium sp.]